MRTIEKLRWQPRWVSHLGCIEGCLKYLKSKVPTAWLYGSTGHAFALNLAQDLCPSGPTAWRTDMLFKLAPNLGYKVEGMLTLKSNPRFSEQQERAWAFVKNCIDNGVPCYGWELDVAEYDVINGYTDGGYIYSRPGHVKETGLLPWNELGTSPIGILEIHSVHPTDTADSSKAIKESFQNVLYHAGNPSDLILPSYRSGIAGYDW